MTPCTASCTHAEIGNEVVTPDFAGRALAMESRARSIGKGGVLRFACPSNAIDVDQVINASRILGNRVYVDVHDGGTNSLENARTRVATYPSSARRKRGSASLCLS